MKKNKNNSKIPLPVRGGDKGGARTEAITAGKSDNSNIYASTMNSSQYFESGFRSALTPPLAPRLAGRGTGNFGKIFMSAFLFLLVFFIWTSQSSADELNLSNNTDTWASWEKRLDRAFENINPRKIPGASIGFVVPWDERLDILSMHALAYSVLANERLRTIVYLMPAPAELKAEGLVIPGSDLLESSVGVFSIDTFLAGEIKLPGVPITVNSEAFTYPISRPLDNQLALLKYVLRSKSPKIKVLPIYVKLNDVNGQVKDIASILAEKIKDLGLEQDITFVITANLTKTISEEKLISADSIWLNSIRNLDVDSMISMTVNSSTETKSAQGDVLALGTMLLRLLKADHGEILAYAHSAQLVLTKDKQSPLSYATAVFASGPPLPGKVPHINREKMVDLFDELFRSDILTVTRQTCASILDATAAKPPSLINPQAAKKWPVYVSIYDADGKVAGQAGTHIPIGPLEESIRKFSFEAVQMARPKLSKENFSKYVVDVSIPYGFDTVSFPEELVPQLNGIIMVKDHKKFAFHPDAWRTYPDPHQLLGAICYKIGLRPWDYATTRATIESFRVLGFNEKEPFQDLGAASRNKKKKKGTEEGGDDAGGGTGGGGGAGGFPF